MYSTCIFCHSSLGKNESVEHFPIGRRLAFDAIHGRLWVVCRSCERWNLTPIEERWEAVEECERAFSNTKLRVSTDNIGLARLRDGTDLVRVGKPMRPEMAAWRYGDQFGRRRRRHQIYAAGGSVIAFGLIAGQLIGTKIGGLGVSLGALASISSSARIFGMKAYNTMRSRTRFSVSERQTPLLLTSNQLDRVNLKSDDADGWSIAFPFSTVPRTPLRVLVTRIQRMSLEEDDIVLRGESARRAVAKLLPAINAASAPAGQVKEAVDMLEESADADALFRRWARWPAKRAEKWERQVIMTPSGQMHESFLPPDFWSGYPLRMLPAPARLALEMASHEDAERRALEGELAALEDEWRDAEEIAAIADSMFAPKLDVER